MSDRRISTVRSGGALLALLVAISTLGPLVWPPSPDRQLDPAVAGLAPPGARFAVVRLADGRELAATAVDLGAGAVVLHGQPRPTTIPMRDLAGAPTEAISSRSFPLGSDEFGRDVAARLFAGGRTSLAVAFATVLLITLVALPLGTLLGAAPGPIDRGALRVLEGLQAFPRLFLLLGLAAILHPSTLSVVLLLGLTGWIPMTRLVRSQVRSLRESEFVLAARAAGASRWRIAWRHLLPNALAPALVEASLAAASAILNEAALSFLGFGLQPPAASWGNMIADGRSMLGSGWWIAFFPGMALALAAIAFNLVGEGLRDRWDPRTRERARAASGPPAAGTSDLAAPPSSRAMEVGAFDFELPDASIAQEAAPRGTSRLMHLTAEGPPRHARIADLPEILRPGDLLIANDTRVIPARLFVERIVAGSEVRARVELLLVEKLGPRRWHCLARPGRKARPGTELRVDDSISAQVVEKLEDGRHTVAFSEELEPHLDRLGHVPLPPYIARADRAEDRARYQTIWAREPGAIAAPTAGLHFSEELLAQLDARGVERAFVTLHVGIGTFKPVTVERVDEHRMERERYEIPEATATAIARARSEGRRVIAVGTTVVRTLESAALEDGSVRPGPGATAIFITPGFDFRIVDLLVTNFHLPRSTLLMLVSAFAGRERILAAYAEAIASGYRFYSYGDAMLLERARHG